MTPSGKQTDWDSKQKMTDVIQIFKSVERIQKPDYSTETRLFFDKWEQSFISKTGYLAGQTLFLPTGTKQDPDIKTAALVIIQDINGFDPFLVEKTWNTTNMPKRFKGSGKSHLLATNRQLICLNRPLRSGSFEIFKIEKNNSGNFDLHLNYSANKFYIGSPNRNDHKIAELKLHKPVRYKMNGKSDFTMTGRKQRTFVVYDYIFEYLGQAEKIEFKDLNKIIQTKTVPTDYYKIVDERKILK